MGIGNTILAFTNGAARGALQGDQLKFDRLQQSLRTLAQLAQLPGFSLGDNGAPAAPAAPAMPSATDQATSPLPPILRGARAPGGPAAPTAAPSTAPTGGPIRVGSLRLGGGDRSILFDPSMTPGGLERARLARNQQAYQRLETQAPGSQGDYDPDFDYETAERTSLKQSQLKTALKQSGYSDADAELLSKFNVDAEERREKRAQLQAEQARVANEQAATAMQRSREDQAELEDEATGLLESGASSAVIGAALKALHPKLSASVITRAVGGAVASQTIRKATIDQRERVGAGAATKKKGLNIMGIQVDPSELGGDTTGASMPGLDAQDSAMAASDPAFRAWLLEQRAKPATP